MTYRRKTEEMEKDQDLGLLARGMNIIGPRAFVDRPTDDKVTADT